MESASAAPDPCAVVSGITKDRLAVPLSSGTATATSSAFSVAHLVVRRANVLIDIHYHGTGSQPTTPSVLDVGRQAVAALSVH